MAADARLAARVLTALRRAGTAYVLVRSTAAVNASTPWKASTVTTASHTLVGIRQDRTGAFGELGNAEAPQSDVKTFEGVYLVAASGLTVVPTAGDLLTADGATRRVTSVEELRPAGVPLLYALHVER